MKALIALPTIVVLASGCVTSKPITTASGQRGHVIDCSAGNMGNCLEKAGDLCGANGYDTLDQKDKESFWTGNDKRMVITCR